MELLANIYCGKMTLQELAAIAETEKNKSKLHKAFVTLTKTKTWEEAKQTLVHQIFFTLTNH